MFFTVTAEYTGSGAGIESLCAGSIDIGNASRSLSEDELAEGVVENIVAIDGIAVIVDNDNTATDLTTEQLAQIYTGEISNWSEVGGNDEAIVGIGRESGSGTRGAFEELLEIEDNCKYAQELDSTGGVLATEMLLHAIEAYVERNAVKAEEVIRHDDIVDELFLKVKSELIDIIREHPDQGEQAAELMMVNKYLERIGDHAANIAEWVIFALDDHMEEKK